MDKKKELKKEPEPKEVQRCPFCWAKPVFFYLDSEGNCIGCPDCIRTSETWEH